MKCNNKINKNSFQNSLKFYFKVGRGVLRTHLFISLLKYSIAASASPEVLMTSGRGNLSPLNFRWLWSRIRATIHIYQTRACIPSLIQSINQLTWIFSTINHNKKLHKMIVPMFKLRSTQNHSQNINCI